MVVWIRENITTPTGSSSFWYVLNSLKFRKATIVNGSELLVDGANSLENEHNKGVSAGILVAVSRLRCNVGAKGRAGAWC